MISKARLQQLAKKHGTPLFIIDHDALRHHGFQDLDADGPDLGVHPVERATPRGVHVHLLIASHHAEGGVDHVAVRVHAEGQREEERASGVGPVEEEPVVVVRVAGRGHGQWPGGLVDGVVVERRQHRLGQVHAGRPYVPSSVRSPGRSQARPWACSPGRAACGAGSALT